VDKDRCGIEDADLEKASTAKVVESVVVKLILDINSSGSRAMLAK
jgi:hypothetical protein